MGVSVVEILTPPTELPIIALDARNHLRLNWTNEDPYLVELIGSAVEQYEHDTRRPILPTTYRQYFTTWPGCVLTLARGGVSSVVSVRRYLADGSAAAISDYTADLKRSPAIIHLATTPDDLTHTDGTPVRPVGYVDYVAGWASGATVPKRIKTALKLLVAHWYANREAYAVREMKELASGWSAVCRAYALGPIVGADE